MSMLQNSKQGNIRDDPKERNVNAITLPNQLWHACHALASASSVIITTGSNILFFHNYHLLSRELLEHLGLQTLASLLNSFLFAGFPCLIDFAIPTESDGPLGAVMLARTLCLLGKKVILFVNWALT